MAVVVPCVFLLSMENISNGMMICWHAYIGKFSVHMCSDGRLLQGHSRSKY